MKPVSNLFSGPNWLYGAFGGKIVPDENFAQFCFESPLEFVFPKNTFLVGMFWRNRPHTSFLGLIGYMVRSGANLFRSKTLLNLSSEALSNSFFPKKTFLVWIFVLNRTSSIFLAKRTRWREWGQKWPGAKFRPPKKTRFRLEFFYKTGPIPLFWA